MILTIALDILVSNLAYTASLHGLLALAIQPFHEPLPIDRYWIVLLLPMVVAISVVYKTIKIKDLSQLPRQATSLAFHIIMFMTLAAAMLWLVTELL